MKNNYESISSQFHRSILNKGYILQRNNINVLRHKTQKMPFFDLVTHSPPSFTNNTQKKCIFVAL